MSGGDWIELEAVTKRFGRTVAVDDLHLAVARGEILALLGPSGSGKTSVLRVIAGLLRPDAGAVRLAGRTVSSEQSWVPPERRGVGFVFQDYALFPHLDVARNVAFGLASRQVGERRARVAELLDSVGLTGLEGRYPHELSGGQQQRVALARALAPDPVVVLLDEPFSNLDADLRARTREEVVRVLRETHATAIFVTHDQEEAFAIASRVAVLNAGRLEQLDAPETLYRSPATRFVADFVVRGAVLPAEVRGGRLQSEVAVLDGSVDAPDGDYDLLLRPDDLELRRDGAASALVLARRFVGPRAECRVRLASGLEVRAFEPEGPALAPGDRVAVRLLSVRPVLLPKRDAHASRSGGPAR